MSSWVILGPHKCTARGELLYCPKVLFLENRREGQEGQGLPKEKTKQIVSKQRVTDHGEVFTAAREVKAMCDLVKSETERIDSRFLEPACGKGAFLAEVLRRKLAVVKTRYQKSPSDYERHAFLAISSLYGIDILADNVADCRQSLWALFHEEYTRILKRACSPEYERAIRFLLTQNIIWGDALTLLRVDEPNEPIVFSEWSFVTATQVQRRDFMFSNLLSRAMDDLPLFSDLGEEVWLPKPVKVFPVCHYLEVADCDDGSPRRCAARDDGVGFVRHCEERSDEAIQSHRPDKKEVTQ